MLHIAVRGNRDRLSVVLSGDVLATTRQPQEGLGRGNSTGKFRSRRPSSPASTPVETFGASPAALLASSKASDSFTGFMRRSITKASRSMAKAWTRRQVPNYGT